MDWFLLFLPVPNLVFHLRKNDLKLQSAKFSRIRTITVKQMTVQVPKLSTPVNNENEESRNAEFGVGATRFVDSLFGQ